MIEKIKRSSPGVVNLSKAFMDLTNDVVCRAVLGRTYGSSEDGERDFNMILGKLIEMLGKFDVGDFVPWLGWINRVNGVEAQVENVFKMLDEFLEGVLREYRRKKLSDDAVVNFVDALLEFQRESKDSDPVDDDQIKALILDMFAAGTDATFTALEWTMAGLIIHEATSKGTLPRELTQDTNLLCYDIPHGALVLVNCWGISRDLSLWENPNEFLPERFFDTSIDYKGLDFEMIPFESGRRGCSGIAFAMSIYELALSRLVNEFDFGLPNGGRVEDLDMTEAPGIIVHKKSPLLLVPTSC
ncbi:hypothetical protein SASPL_151949 [Salvia splendens]|uniref:Uncharacterized protein n=1 Tax=Salvia splendens TaxID=180675 RepID=A0A8X8W249_SALSN|nr:hypothetical protein SASPL_151949 [Salvia splendens]